MKRRIRTAPGWMRRLAALLCALTLVLSLPPAALGAENEAVLTSNLGRDSNNYSVMSYLYANEKGGLTRVERYDWGMRMLIEEYNSSYQLVSRRFIPNGTTFSGFYAGKDYNFLCFNSLNSKEDDSTEVFRVDKYSKDWQFLGSGSLRGANTSTMHGNNVQLSEKNGMLFVHTGHTMYRTEDGKRHQANLSVTFRISDMAVVDSFHGIGGPTYVSHSLEGWHILADQEDNVVMFEVGDGHPRAPVFHRLKGYAATADHSAQVERVKLFDIPGASGDNYTGVTASGLEETRNYYVLAYRANRALPGSIVPYGPCDNYLAFISKSDLSIKTVKLTSPDETTFPRLVSTGLDGGYALWRSSQNNSQGELYLAAYSDGAVTSTQNLGKGRMSDCPPILYNGRLVWYCTQESAPVFYGADTTGVRVLDASVTAPGNLGGPVVKPAAPAVPSVPAAPTAGGFRDVPASSPYAEGVVWAAEKGVTSGKSAGVFAPGEACTNGQILTFLWRAAGSPEPFIENPFYDEIPASFQKAALWAYETGLVSGTAFGAGIPCTRAMTVDYLWKAAGSPAARAASFADVPASAPYAQAVAWAVEKGITAGTGAGQFSPGASCTRGQIVTFLYRAYA